MATSYHKKKILVQDQGGGVIWAAGILTYVEDLSCANNAEIGIKDYFEIACINLKVTATAKGSDITFDLSGSAPEQDGPDNGLWVTTLSVARSAVKAIAIPKLPTYEGFNMPITVIAPQGSVSNANPGVPFSYMGIRKERKNYNRKA